MNSSDRSVEASRMHFVVTWMQGNLSTELVVLDAQLEKMTNESFLGEINSRSW